ncbi:flagellar biosynthesis protein FlhB [Spirochaetia bacterium]|nr:flagellar biosynthesis protein FlhB [Spirochaetia bacterium]
MRNEKLKIKNEELEEFDKVEPSCSFPISHSSFFIDLQWFAAEEEGRTEEPTETKIRKAREEGRVVKSQELIGAIGLLLPAMALLFMAPYMLRTCAEMIRFFFLRIAEIDPVKDRIIFAVFLNYFVKLALPLLIVAMAAGIFSNVVQIGFLFTTKPLEFKIDKIIPNFSAYFSKTLFSTNGVFNFFKSIIKMVIIGGVAFFLIRHDINKLANLQTADLFLSVRTIATLAVKMIIFSAILLLVLSIPDYMFQRSQFRESLKMSRQEIVEERKEDEGDPQIKQRLRKRMQEIMSTKIRESVPKADIVITNPTHFAVALQFDKWMGAMRVLIKGEDETALRIKKIAYEYNIDVVENKPLARALYAEVEIGDVVPEKFWRIISEVIQSVKSLDEINRMVGR